MSSDRHQVRPRLIALVVALGAAGGAVLMAGCGRNDAADQQTPVLMLYCGAGLREPVAQLITEFEQHNRVTFATDYAGAEHLINKIKLTGRGDLYLPGDRYYVDLLAGSKRVRSRRTVCYFVPTILVVKGNPKNIHTLADLLKPGVKLGLGDEKAAAIGRKSRKIFEKNGFDWADVLAHTQYQAPTVNALGEHIAVGSLDAVIIWDGLVGGFADHAQAVPISPDQNIISTVDIAVLTGSAHPVLAERFVEFLTSERAKQVFRKHHFSVEPPAPAAPTGES